MHEYLIYSAFALLCGTSLVFALNDRCLSKKNKLLAVFLLPIISLSLYHILGTPSQPDTPMSQRQNLFPFIVAESQLLLERPLLTSLQENPKNIKLWQQLVEIYIAAGRLNQAAITLRDAYQATQDISFKERLGDVLVEMPELKTTND